MRAELCRLCAGALAALALVGAAAHAAEPLPEPQGRVILEITGEIDVTNQGEAAAFDRAMLTALPQAELTTYTDWTEGEQVFTGPRLADVLERVGAGGDTLHARALNDYEADIPRSDAQQYKVVLALRRNGEQLSVRDKGPIWIVYPHPNPESEEPSPHNYKSVWQLEAIDVR